MSQSALSRPGPGAGSGLHSRPPGQRKPPQGSTRGVRPVSPGDRVAPPPRPDRPAGPPGRLPQPQREGRPWSPDKPGSRRGFFSKSGKPQNATVSAFIFSDSLKVHGRVPVPGQLERRPPAGASMQRPSQDEALSVRPPLRTHTSLSSSKARQRRHTRGKRTGGPRAALQAGREDRPQPSCGAAMPTSGHYSGHTLRTQAFCCDHRLLRPFKGPQKRQPGPGGSRQSASRQSPGALPTRVQTTPAHAPGRGAARPLWAAGLARGTRQGDRHPPAVRTTQMRWGAWGGPASPRRLRRPLAGPLRAVHTKHLDRISTSKPPAGARPSVSITPERPLRGAREPRAGPGSPLQPTLPVVLLSFQKFPGPAGA